MRERVGDVARELLVLRPHGDAHLVALRAGVSVLVPLLVLWSVDRLDWALFAAFGAFTSLYGRNHVHVPRLVMQARLGVLLTSLVGAGVLVGTSEHRAWLAVPLAAVLASGAQLLSDAQDWHPPGALFPIFAFTACASLTSTLADVGPAVLVAGASAAFSVLVGNLHALSRGRRRDRPDPQTGHRPPRVLRFPANGVAVLLAGAIATGAGIGHPYWAMVSAVVPLVARDLLAQVVRGIHRVVGTFLGLAVAWALFTAEPGGLVLILLIAALQVGAELLVGRNYALALTCITPLALLSVHLAAGDRDSDVLLVDRGVETVIGVAVGVAVGYLSRPGHRARRAGRRPPQPS